MFCNRQNRHPKFLEVARLLIENNVNVNAKTTNVSRRCAPTALLALCKYYNKEDVIDIIRMLIEKQVDVNDVYPNGSSSALLLLCQYYKHENLIDIIKLLVDNNANVNYRTKDGDNILNLLCRHYLRTNLIELVRFLIDKIKFDNGKNDAWRVVQLLQESKLSNAAEIIQVIIHPH